MARWLEQGTHRIVPWECDLSSQTGASQAGLLLGSNDDMPAFRWYEKESGRTVVSNHGKDAVELERRHSDGGGLLAAGGASRGNLFSGDAPHCSATMSVLRDKQRSSAREYFAYFADPYGFTRTVALYLWDVLLELRAARRQRRSGEEHIDRGGLYPWMRARSRWSCATSTSRRCSATSSRVSPSSTPPSSATTRSRTTGIEQPDALPS